MRNLCHHDTVGWLVFSLDDLVETVEVEALDDELMLELGAYFGTKVLQLDFGGCVGISHWIKAPLNLLSEELKLFDCLTAQSGDFGLVAKLDESVEGGLDNVVRVGGAERLGEHVLDASSGHDSTDRLAGNDAGTFGSRLQHDLAGAKVAQHLVRNGGVGEVD